MPVDFQEVAIGCFLFLAGLLFHKPLSPKHRSALLPLQHAATFISSVDWGSAEVGHHFF